ncbi:sugar kinase [Actinomadura sp. HBU206391]|uniref:sugar kinase n=1 Tax=Actinomadura sp. HBU206391 TaxID=2731692 RepID=UPI0016506B05|nr:sugar kinase [Actinomadura sp. HBU206391]MBC6460620.1 sugar kinase [Actinomadura sp. HBU206391]
MNESSPPRVIGLGESLLRLSAPGHERLEQAAHLQVHVGGAELNALIGAAALGLSATWVSRLADNPLGRRVAAHAATYGVRSIVDWDPDARAPLYFVEHGAPPRPSEVLYDRSGTAMVGLGSGTFPWQRLVAGADAVLCSGITCAIGDGPAAAVNALFAAARDAGVRTVFDVNHRSRMWSWNQAVPVLTGVLPRVDLLLAGREDLVRLLADGDRDGDGDGGLDGGRDGGQGQVALARRAIERFGHEMVLLRDTVQLSSRRVTVNVTAVTADDVCTSSAYEAEVVDAFGTGDAALAAFLSGRLSGEDLEACVDKAAWAGAFQHTVSGDAWQARPSELARRGAPARRILR